MTNFNIPTFINGLIEKTSNGRIAWEPINLYPHNDTLWEELADRKGWYGETPILPDSYYFEKNKGFVLLLKIDTEAVTCFKTTSILLVLRPSSGEFYTQLNNADDNQEQLISLMFEIKECLSLIGGEANEYSEQLNSFMSSILEDEEGS